MLGRFVRNQRDVQAAEHHRNARGTVPIGERVRRLDPGGERRDAHQVETLELVTLGRKGVDLAVPDLDVRWRQGGDGQQAQAGQRRNHLAATDELR